MLDERGFARDIISKVSKDLIVLSNDVVLRLVDHG
jgi:hypothetical protein